jgi:hypothetical protein
VPRQNLFGSLLGRIVSGQSTGKVTADAIGGEDECISCGYGDNLNIK